MDIFERASRAKLRFESAVGLLSTEDLWDLDLTARKGASLDTLARGVFSELKGIEEVSFVETKPNVRKTELELKLDILKHVIEAKKTAIKAAETRAANAARRERLLAAKADKEAGKIAEMSMEDIDRELASLNEAA